jgi:hypothetical protein
MEHRYGCSNRSLRDVPDRLPVGNGEDYHRAARLDTDFRRHNPTRVRASFSEDRGGFLKLVAAALFVVTGAGLAFAPMENVEALTGLLGTLLLVQAGLATVAAFQIRPLAGWAWFLIDGGASFLLGALIMLKWPSSSVWAIGTLVGVSVLMSGIARIIVAAKIRDGVCSVERSLRTAA